LKPAFKYAVISALYQAEEEGLWEYEIYSLLKDKYEKAALCSLREDLVGFSTIGWLSVIAIREYQGTMLRKFRLQQRHKPFIEYHLSPEQVLASLGINDDPRVLVAMGRGE
jgi:hypothetical protein